MAKFYVITLCCVLFVLQALSDQPIGGQYSDLVISDQSEPAESGVLITGGAPNDKTTELYLPSSATSCTLPGLPDSRRFHSLDEDLMCGGSYTRDSCLQWSPDTGSWEAAVTLDVERYGHISWTSVTRGTFLMGGSVSARTTTLIKPDGTQEPGFPLKYDAYLACAIPDPVTDTVVVTGGVGTMNTVVRYGQQGWLEDLPDLITGRWYHACSSFVSSGRVMFLVTGGYYGSRLDSTETFDPMLGSWAASGAKLPRPMSSLRAANINDRLLIFGGHDYDDGNNYEYDDILEYQPEEDTFTTVGHMIQARSYHAVSVVQADDFLQWCQ